MVTGERLERCEVNIEDVVKVVHAWHTLANVNISSGESNQ